MKNILYSNNKSKENGIGNVENISLLPIPTQPSSDQQGNIKKIIHTTVTKTTTNEIPSNELNESFNKINNLDALSTISSTNLNYNDGIASSSSSQSNSMDENSKTNTISTTENIIDESGFDNSKRISSTPGGSFKLMKTIIRKQHNTNDSNGRSNLGRPTIGFHRQNTPSNNIVSSMASPSGYNTVTMAIVDRDNNAFNKGISSRKQNIRFNNFNALGNSMSETGALQNPNSFVQTETTILKNERAADDIKLGDLNDKKIDYNVGDGMSISNNNANLNYDTKFSNNNGNDDGSGYSYGYAFGNGIDVGNYNNIGDIISSSHLMDGSLSEGYSSYILLPNGCSQGNGKGKKRKKNGSMKKYKGSRSKSISYGNNKGNGQIRVKNGRNYKNTRSSKNRSGGSSQYYSSTSYVRGGKNNASSSSASFSDESSMKTKKPCHCKKGRKLNKRDSSESHESSLSKEHNGPEIYYLGSSIDNQPMQNIGDFVPGFPLPIPPSMKREPQSNLSFDLIQGQRPDQSLNYSQSDLETVLNRLDKTRNLPINDQQLPNIDVSNQYSIYQIPNTGTLFQPDYQQRQYVGPLGLDLNLDYDSGPQFDSKPYFLRNYLKYLENNLQPSPLSQPPYPYSFNQDFYSGLSKMDLTIPKFTDIQSGQDNQLNIYNDLPQMQQDIEGNGLNQMDELNSRSMTTHTQSPIIQYFKTTKTTKNIDDNGTPDIRIVQTQSDPPKVDGNYII